MPRFTDDNGDKFDDISEWFFAEELKDRGIIFTRQDKYMLPSRFFRSHSWSSDFEFDYKGKHFVIDVKGWMKYDDRVKLSFVEFVHQIKVDIVTYKIKQKNKIKSYIFDMAWLDD